MDAIKSKMTLLVVSGDFVLTAEDVNSFLRDC